ncbi:hypothetical protein M2128_002188 [Polynucleobacter sphagniphilus]|uniref:hypothetical protein n=1 Tax=Polynucleobacter sphagniphilus TaxID=1743169 RepID=UPI002476975C|nr:hypothetical protein [Polynucleobacter sphagniphilus]MDH6303242.1 hypothetical protein [Polynucleobacter sphagniphilus]
MKLTREKNEYGCKIPKSLSYVKNADGFHLFTAFKRSPGQDAEPFALLGYEVNSGMTMIDIAGDRLNTFDAKVLMTVYAFAKKKQSALEFEQAYKFAITFIEIEESLDLARSKSTRRAILDSLYRLKRLNITEQPTRRAMELKKYVGPKVHYQLISDFDFDNHKIMIELDEHIDKMLGSTSGQKLSIINQFSVIYPAEVVSLKSAAAEALIINLSGHVFAGAVNRPFLLETLCDYAWGSSKTSLRRQRHEMKNNILPLLGKLKNWKIEQDSSNENKYLFSRAA